MPPLTNLQNRVQLDPEWKKDFDAALPRCQAIASKMPLFHASDYKPTGQPARVRFVDLLLGQGVIPTSDEHHNYSGPNARAAEQAMGWTPTVYFYAGRAHPSYGDVKMAFSTADMPLPIRVAPFDTGGMVKYTSNKYYIDFPGFLGNSFVQQAVEECGTNDWREKLAIWLAAYFHSDPEQYFRHARPEKVDPEGIYTPEKTPEPVRDERYFHNTRWTWEVHFDTAIPIVAHCLAWCMTPNVSSEIDERLRADYTSSRERVKINAFLHKKTVGKLPKSDSTPAKLLNEWICKHACT